VRTRRAPNRPHQDRHVISKGVGGGAPPRRRLRAGGRGRGDAAMTARRVSHSRVTPALQVPPSMAANVSKGCGQEDYGKKDGGTDSQPLLDLRTSVTLYIHKRSVVYVIISDASLSRF
jgi:hypothetical protein